MFLSIRYFLIMFFLFRFTNSLSQVILNEIMYDPITGESEWIELHNPTGYEVDLQGWRLSDADTSRKVIITDTESVISISGYVVVSKDSSVFNRFSFLQNQVYVLNGFPRLNNDFDTVFLFDPLEIPVECVEYENSWGGGDGVSIERISPSGFAEDADNWSPCVSIKGATPGCQNSVFSSGILQNTTLSVHPNPFSPDGDGFEDVTEITYHLPMKVGYVNLHIYDVHGRRIRTLMGGRASGSQGSVLWDGRDDRDHISSIGIYIVYLEGLERISGKVKTIKTTVVLGGRL